VLAAAIPHAGSSGYTFVALPNRHLGKCKLASDTEDEHKEAESRCGFRLGGTYTNTDPIDFTKGTMKATENAGLLSSDDGILTVKSYTITSPQVGATSNLNGVGDEFDLDDGQSTVGVTLVGSASIDKPIVNAVGQLVSFTVKGTFEVREPKAAK